ncbi:MAG TPA: hypothetical protein VIK01_21440 [Polyangiaceae bacterium]
MTAALIVIEIAAPNVSDDALAVLVSSCTRTAREAECVLTKNASDEQPAAVAIVSQQSEDKLRVEVGVRQGDHDSWHTKDFAFLAVDQQLDRWRAIGFAIGTLAESTLPPAPPPVAAPEKATEPPMAAVMALPAPSSVSKQTKKKPQPSPQLFVGAAGIFGPGLDRGPWRIGSALYADVGLQRVPVFFTFGGSAATRVTSDQWGASPRWVDVSGGAGIGLLGALGSSGLELRAQALAEEFDVSVSSVDGRSAEQVRWIFGAQGELGGRVQVVPDLFLTAGVSATGLSAKTDVLVEGHGIGSAATFRYLGSFGIRVRLR